MVIHVVQPGETINSIADNYGVTVNKLIQDNDLVNADNLAVGQAILIVYPKELHIVQEGDTLLSIAENYNITVIQLLRNNPFLVDREVIYPGESIVISYTDDKKASITVNGYAYPYINRSVLEKNLLYLTYLSIFSYSVTADGNLNDIDDIEIIHLAKAYGVAPIMIVSNVSEEGNVNREELHNLLLNQELQNDLVENILTVLRTKGYYGVNFDIPYISAEDQQLYLDIISTSTERFHNEGFKVFITITPNSFETEAEGSYEIANLAMLGQITDGVIILSYSWGYASEIPVEALPFYILIALLEYILTQIPADKIFIGITSIGYIWQIPYIEGVSRANSISNVNAVQLASDSGAEIYYNSNNHSSYFYILNERNYLVYFHDVRGVDASLNAVTEYDLQGVGIWNIMYYQAQTFLLINSQYEIAAVQWEGYMQ